MERPPRLDLKVAPSAPLQIQHLSGTLVLKVLTERFPGGVERNDLLDHFAGRMLSPRSALGAKGRLARKLDNLLKRLAQRRHIQMPDGKFGRIELPPSPTSTSLSGSSPRHGLSQQPKFPPLSTFLRRKLFAAKLAMDGDESPEKSTRVRTTRAAFMDAAKEEGWRPSHIDEALGIGTPPPQSPSALGPPRTAPSDWVELGVAYRFIKSLLHERTTLNTTEALAACECAHLLCSGTMLRQILQRLVDCGMARRTGRTRGTRYHLVDESLCIGTPLAGDPPPRPRPRATILEEPPQRAPLSLNGVSIIEVLAEHFPNGVSCKGLLNHFAERMLTPNSAPGAKSRLARQLFRMLERLYQQNFIRMPGQIELALGSIRAQRSVPPLLSHQLRKKLFAAKLAMDGDESPEKSTRVRTTRAAFMKAAKKEGWNTSQVNEVLGRGFSRTRAPSKATSRKWSRIGKAYRFVESLLHKQLTISVKEVQFACYNANLRLPDVVIYLVLKWLVENGVARRTGRTAATRYHLLQP